MRVGWNSISHVGPAKHQRQFSDTQTVSSTFPPTDNEHRLKLTVGPKGLEKVMWDDKVLDELRVEKAALPPRPEAYKGKFGIYAFKGNGLFRDGRYLFQEEP